MLTRAEAGVLCALLDSVSDGNMAAVRAGMRARQLTPEEVIAAWKRLEQLAGICGTVPELSDFV